MWNRLLAVMLVGLLGVGQAMAQTDMEKDTAIADVLACRGLVDGHARLICLDSALPSLAFAFPQTQLSNDERKEAAQRQREQSLAAAEAAFGQSIEQSNIVQEEEPKDADKQVNSLELVDTDQITSKVVRFDESIKNKAIIYLENGQIWQQLDSDSTRVSKSKAVGAEATVKQKLMNSYMMQIGNTRSFRVRRLK